MSRIKAPLHLSHIGYVQTLTALTIEFSHNNNVYNFLYNRLNGGYTGIINFIIHTAKQFEEYYVNRDWDQISWYDTIDAWVKETLEELGYDKEETYTL